jgi:hypothetical protein
VAPCRWVSNNPPRKREKGEAVYGSVNSSQEELGFSR